MAKIGDRYVIEIDGVFSGRNIADITPKYLYHIKGFNSLVFDENGIKKLLKYEDCNEIDLAKARKQGYEEGFAAAEKKRSDTIHIGDEVEYGIDGAKGIVLHIGEVLNQIIRHDGQVALINRYTDSIRKTGKTYPISEMVEELNEEKG